MSEMVQLKLLISECLIGIAFKLAADHWSDDTLLKFSAFIKSIRESMNGN